MNNNGLDKTAKVVLFYRNFRAFTGGHLNVWHYFNHILHSSTYVPRIRFSKESVWDESNPWRESQQYRIPLEALPKTDVVFLAGMDWLSLTEEQRIASSVPIINLIQHVRHAWPEQKLSMSHTAGVGGLLGSAWTTVHAIRRRIVARREQNHARWEKPQKLYTFLKHKAIRICISPEVAEAIKKTKRVEGPIFVIPNGIDVNEFPEPIPRAEKDLDVLIVANKQPAMGQKMKIRLQQPGRKIHLLDAMILRPAFLQLMNRAKTTVFFPNRAEGFYLPAIEAMVLNSIVVCPDCIANRSFCLDNWNCFRPEYSLPAIQTAAEAAIQLQSVEIGKFLANAKRMTKQHTLLNERKEFLNILENVQKIW